MAAFDLVETNSMNAYQRMTPNMDLCDKFFYIYERISKNNKNISNFKIIFILKFAVADRTQQLKQHMTLGVYFLDKYNHFAKKFLIFFC